MSSNMIKKQLSAAYRYSYSALALNYYALFELMAEDSERPDTFDTYAVRFHALLQSFLDGEDCTAGLDVLRNQVTEIMDIITAYTDCLQIYEYVLNRMERRFQEPIGPVEELETFVPKLIKFLLATKDTSTINFRIQQTIAQLPVRYTKQKFFSLLLERLSVYIGSDQRNLADMLYILRTESMVQLPEGMQHNYADLFQLLEQLRAADYLHMEKSQFEEYIDKITQTADRLTTDADAYLLLQDDINSLYVLLLTQSDAVIDVSEKQLLETMVRSVLMSCQNGNTSKTEDEITNMLYQLEGWQESSMERYLSCPGQGSLSKDPMNVKIRKIEKLLSGSSFAGLEEESNLAVSVERSYLEEQVTKFCKELDAVFAGLKKPVVRAIMASVLSRLPVAFRSVDELTEYVTSSFESCTDMAERETSVELLNLMMEIEDALV